MHRGGQRGSSAPFFHQQKNSLITRDTDLLRELAEQGLCRTAISINSLDQSLTKRLEPACTAPAGRLEAISSLSSAGVPVHAMVAPIIPGSMITKSLPY